MKSFCIIGLGRFGRALAETLAAAKKEVLVIDSDEKNIESIADSVDSAILGDCTEEAVLRAAGVADYDCVALCISENANDSVMATIVLKELGVKYLIARAADERHARVLEKLGADRVVLPESDIGRRVGLALSHEGVQQYMEFSEDTAIVEMEVPARWVGKTLLELDVRKKMNINVITVRKKNVHKKGISVAPNSKFGAGDTVTVIGQKEDIRRMLAHQGN